MIDLAVFFTAPKDPNHRRYEALRAFYYEGKTADEISGLFGYTTSTVYSLARDFGHLFENGDPVRSFFVLPQIGRRRKTPENDTYMLIIDLRKKYLSVPDIKAVLDSLNHDVSERYVSNVVNREGFGRLPRRNTAQRTEALNAVEINAEKSRLLSLKKVEFQSHNAIGLLCFLPYIEKYGIDKLIKSTPFPQTKTIPRLNSILSFLALKLSNVRRYTSDNIWCMDRGLGLFAGLNVLPKTSWFSSYSNRVTRKTNRQFLKRLHKTLVNSSMVSNTANIDFTSIPYWGDDSHLENNWAGTRNKALPSILAAIAQDPDTGVITYGDTTVRHNNKDDVAVEFLDFYNRSNKQKLSYLVFDSKFTTYQNLKKLDRRNVKFLTIRRRGKKIVDRLNSLDRSFWKKIRVPSAGGKTRLLKVLDEEVFLKEYNGDIRQISITGHGRIKPAIILTNDLDLKTEEIVRKYARRWLVEKNISEQIEFFHLNRVSSSMVIKVDFDLTMTILAHNLYRFIAQDIDGYADATAVTLFEQFIQNGGDIKVTESEVVVNLKKKRNLPGLLTAMESFHGTKIPWLAQRKILFLGATRS
jgi:transposase